MKSGNKRGSTALWPTQMSCKCLDFRGGSDVDTLKPKALVEMNVDLSMVLLCICNSALVRA